MLCWCFINTPSFVHHKWGSTPQTINGKCNNLQKLLRYLSGIVTSTFKFGAGGYGGQFTFPEFQDCDNFSAISIPIFVLYSNDLSSETLSLTSTSPILCL